VGRRRVRGHGHHRVNAPRQAGVTVRTRRRKHHAGGQNRFRSARLKERRTSSAGGSLVVGWRVLSGRGERSDRGVRQATVLEPGYAGSSSRFAHHDPPASSRNPCSPTWSRTQRRAVEGTLKFRAAGLPASDQPLARATYQRKPASPPGCMSMPQRAFWTRVIPMSGCRAGRQNVLPATAARLSSGRGHST
jgi:hypothetical protein